MKHLLVFLVSGLVVTYILSCIKEEPIEQQKSNVVYTVDDFNPNEDYFGRDGVRLPFDFPGSQVIFDPFVPTRTQIAFNQMKLDSAVYERTSTSGAGYQGIIWHKYISIKYFGDTIYKHEVYAPALLGSNKVIYPNVEFNQLNIDNQKNCITLLLQRSEPYYDAWCGKAKKRYMYKIIGNSTDTLGMNSIDSKQCNSNNFSYQLIISQ